MKRMASFRRRKKQNYSAAATAATAHADANEPTQQFPSPEDSERPIGRINIIQGNQPPIKVIQFADKGSSSATAAALPAAAAARADNVSPITIIDRPDPEATMKTLERVVLPVPRDNNDKRNPTPYNTVDSKSFGTDQHLSTREQMWYKNQMYLLAKQQQQQQQQNGVSSMSSSKVESIAIDGADRHRYSPRGVDEFENHPWKKCDDDYDDYTYSDDDDDTRTNLSTKLMEDDEDSCTTTQYTSALEDDTRTYLSSLLFDDDDDDANSDSSDVFDDVDLALDSAISGYTTNATESESLFTSLEDGTSMPYVFELKDDGVKQRPKYQLGVGLNPDFSGRRKSRRSSSKTKRTDLSTTSYPQRDRRKVNSKVDASSEDYVECPLLQVFLEEVSGTYKDAKLALDQVLHAFCISPDNLDIISDKLSDAKVELLEMYRQRGPRRGDAMNYSFQHVR